MSTNDTIIALANGAGVPTEQSSKMEEIDEGTDPEPYHFFWDKLITLAKKNADLAQLVVRDGKAATKFVEVSVETRTASRRLILASAPVKTALYAEEVNLGRILSSTGSETLGTALDPSSVSVSFVPSSPTNSTSTDPSSRHVLTNDEHLGRVRDRDGWVRGTQGVRGKEGARYWTCDFSYVRNLYIYDCTLGRGLTASAFYHYHDLHIGGYCVWKEWVLKKQESEDVSTCLSSLTGFTSATAD